ncbi:hypothetical protein K504DRAFT_488727 [Pleomassaria siparia CBS 279.74]|uniref:DUF3112 domain-containing protein n=1 Tax=Pleomassaria siparia CBS 279.74 TaxID=1314801 RepID=A0A6G1KI93_9PLEO|nr:hypothetical protein K504DRAFT_488727 [Pleomassaria siparia CBS 279.74]
MSAPGSSGLQQSGALPGPPYPPTNIGLGGTPDILPDIPASAVFLVLYIVLFATHNTILRKNNARGHKFVFNGALFAFCAIRVCTMSLRIAWSFHKTNVSLAIAAQVFVYVGTIILYIMNWFFAQRVVRAQHPRWGWSLPYRVFHRAALICLIITLLLLIVAAIQQFFTLSVETHRIDRDLQLLGQTYFAAFCLGPLVLVAVSMLLPKRVPTEKFGAGRFRINVIILVFCVVILSTGQIFRCVTTWLPPVPLRSAKGIPNAIPWYFSKACFFIFNFTTEVIVVIAYAVLRIDRRFHIPDGSKVAGDYAAGRDDLYHVGVIGNEKNLKRGSKMPLGPLGSHDNLSRDTLYEFENSVFDDTCTLADSLRYPSSVLEVDSKTGNWKIKRQSSTPSTHTRYSTGSQPTLWSPDRDTYVGDDDAPPVPALPSGDWILRESGTSRVHLPSTEPGRAMTPRYSDDRSHEIPDHEYNDVDMGDAIADAIANLEANSSMNEMSRASGSRAQYPSHNQDVISSIDKDAGPVLPTHMPRAYQPLSNDRPLTKSVRHSRSSKSLPHNSLAAGYPTAGYSQSASGSSTSLPHPAWTNPSTQKYTPNFSLHRQSMGSRGTNYPPPSSSGSFVTAKAEEEFSRLSSEALPMQYDHGMESRLEQQQREEKRQRGTKERETG